MFVCLTRKKMRTMHTSILSSLAKARRLSTRAASSAFLLPPSRTIFVESSFRYLGEISRNLAKASTCALWFFSGLWRVSARAYNHAKRLFEEVSPELSHTQDNMIAVPERELDHLTSVAWRIDDTRRCRWVRRIEEVEESEGAEGVECVQEGVFVL